MIFGLSIQTFTFIHVIISLLAIASGILVLIGMLRSNQMPGWTAFFMLTTVLTSVTGFLFPIRGLTPAIGTGIVSLILLALALYGHYSKHLSGALAMDLRDHCRRLAVSQCVGADCAIIPENSVPHAAGADPVRAAIPDCPGDRFVRLCRTWHSRGHQVSSSRD